MPELICPYCKSGLRKGSDTIRCLRCDTRHHWICWMEHGNHCSVFSCPGSLIKIRVRKRTDFPILLWCLLNYALHLGLRYAGILNDNLSLPDAVIVVSLESLVVATGIAVLRNRMASDSARSFGTLLFSSNALFLFFLFTYFIAHGFQGLNALIRL